MFTQRRSYIMHTQCRFRIISLVLFWLVGLICGAMIAARFSSSVSFTLQFKPSFLQVLFVSLLPLWLSFLAFQGIFVFLIPIVFLKSISYGFVSVLMICYFGQAGWLLRSLLMFSGVFSACILWIIWISHISGKINDPMRWGLFATPPIVFISYLNVYLIIPFVRRLIPYL